MGVEKRKNKRGYFAGRARLVSAAAIILLVLCPRQGRSEEEADEEAGLFLDRSLSGIRFGVLAYLDYSAGRTGLPEGEEENYNLFSVTRGYFTVKKSMTDWMGMRLTMDVRQESGDAGSKLEGSYVARLKYFYAELEAPDLGFLTDMRSEIGLSHMPWLDFEEHINPYRCQGTMAIERAHVFNSADLGAGVLGYLGGRLEQAEEVTGSPYYDGRRGSWHVGVYNGGGYHAVEKNQNKVVEGRVTLRPLPDHVPGLQVSWLGIYGEGNAAEDDVIKLSSGDTIALDEVPDYVVQDVMLSFQHPAIIITAQYFTARGNQAGSWVDPGGDALRTEGWSVFGNVKVPGTQGKANIFARYDWFDQDPEDEWAEDTAFASVIGGVAFDLYKHNLLLLAYEATRYEDDAGPKGKPPVMDNDLADDQKFQAVWQIKF